MIQFHRTFLIGTFAIALATADAPTSIPFTFNRHFLLMKKIAISFLALAMSIVSVSPSVALAAGSAELTLSPTNTSVETGDTFSLSVLVDPNGESLDTARVELDWDASKLEVLSFDLGSLFPYLSPSNEIDNTNGDLSYGAFKFGTPVTSSGTLATVTFHALASGSTTISVLGSSKLISDGEEQIDTSVLGSSAITISGEAVESEASEETTQEEEESTSSSSGTSDGTEADALAYFGALFGFLPSTDDEWETLHCIAYNDCYDEDSRNLTYEVAALAQFNSKYGANPSAGMDWNAVHALAYTDAGMELLGISVEVEEEEEVVVEEEEEEVSYVDESLSLEQQALVYFGAFYARMPSSGDDWEALHCIAYGGCQGDPRDLQAEQDALVLFGAKYAKMPSTSMEWNVLHTIAYTDLLTWDEQGSEEEAVEEETVVEETQEEEVVVEEETELSVEEQAIGWFGKITGYLPSSDADWTAVDYMVNGYTPETQDLEAESTAITTFVNVFGALPSSDSDWNIIAAIAYSGAF